MISFSRKTVSVIVPIYKVEEYLPKCIESIIGQTYRNLDIILVDDGSPDACGKICDEYAQKDNRIKVCHKNNGGLSDARNFGLMMATGDYIGFVDSDDWIESDMFEVLIKTAEDNNADVVICGVYREFSGQTYIDSSTDMIFHNTKQLVKALLCNNVNNYVWNKLYRKSCFSKLSFPKGHVYEDIAILHKLFLQASTGVSISTPLYHYRMHRQGSINQTRSMNKLIDYWIAYKSRYDFFLTDNRFNMDNKIVDKLRYKCAVSISRTWRGCYAYTKQEIEKNTFFLKEMQDFARNNLSYSDMMGWPFHLKFTIWLARFNNSNVFSLLYYLSQIYRRLKGFYF